MSPKKDILGRLFEIEKSAVKTIAETNDIETVEAMKVCLLYTSDAAADLL